MESKYEIFICLKLKKPDKAITYLHGETTLAGVCGVRVQAMETLSEQQGSSSLTQIFGNIAYVKGL